MFYGWHIWITNSTANENLEILHKRETEKERNKFQFERKISRCRCFVNEIVENTFLEYNYGDCCFGTFATTIEAQMKFPHFSSIQSIFLDVPHVSETFKAFECLRWVPSWRERTWTHSISKSECLRIAWNRRGLMHGDLDFRRFAFPIARFSLLHCKV